MLQPETDVEAVCVTLIQAAPERDAVSVGEAEGVDVVLPVPLALERAVGEKDPVLLADKRRE